MNVIFSSKAEYKTDLNFVVILYTFLLDYELLGIICRQEIVQKLAGHDNQKHSVVSNEHYLGPVNSHK